MTDFDSKCWSLRTKKTVLLCDCDCCYRYDPSPFKSSSWSTELERIEFHFLIFFVFHPHPFDTFSHCFPRCQFFCVSLAWSSFQSQNGMKRLRCSEFTLLSTALEFHTCFMNRCKLRLAMRAVKKKVFLSPPFSTVYESEIQSEADEWKNIFRRLEIFQWLKQYRRNWCDFSRASAPLTKVNISVAFQPQTPDSLVRWKKLYDYYCTHNLSLLRKCLCLRCSVRLSLLSSSRVKGEHMDWEERKLNPFTLLDLKWFPLSNIGK